MFTWVVGLPNGGTSCIAKVLDRLGIYMGDVPKRRAPHGRMYRTYEAKDFWPVINKHRPWMNVDMKVDPHAFAIDCNAYARTRQEAMPRRGHGVKLWMNEALHSKALFNGEHRFVFIDRPFEQCIRGFQRYNQMPPHQLEQFRMYCRKLQGGMLDGMDHARDMGINHSWIPYRDLSAYPEVEVNRMCGELGIDATAKQRHKAIGVIRGYK
jgi:hypothetical protein